MDLQEVIDSLDEVETNTYRSNMLAKLQLDAIRAVSYTHLTLPTTPYV